jgi:hypothetical protein
MSICWWTFDLVNGSATLGENLRLYPLVFAALQCRCIAFRKVNPCHVPGTKTIPDLEWLQENHRVLYWWIAGVDKVILREFFHNSSWSLTEDFCFTGVSYIRCASHNHFLYHMAGGLGERPAIACVESNELRFVLFSTVSNSKRITRKLRLVTIIMKPFQAMWVFTILCAISTYPVP